MTMPFTHKKDEVRATGTLEARTPGDQAVQVLLYVIIALVALACVLPFIYVVAGVLATLLEVITVSGISLQGKVYTSILLILPDAYLASLIYGLLFIGFNYLIVWGLYKKRIFIKI